MKLLYPTSIDLPSTRANRIQIISMARAFAAQLGAEFLLGLHKNDAEAFDFPSVEMPERRSAVLAWQYLALARAKGVTHVFGREERLLAFMMFYNLVWFRLPLKFYYELHHFWHGGWWYGQMLRRVDGIVAITQGLKDALVGAGHPADRILVAPDAVDIPLFDIDLQKAEARARLGLPQDKKIAVYVGAINEPWKGAGVLCRSAAYMGETLVVIAGGKPHYVENFKKEFHPADNVRMEGYIDYAKDLPVYLRAADVAVVPNSGKAEISRVSTSPLKVFAYMASGCPVVASDLPSLREVLNEGNSVLVEADNPEALASGITKLTEDPALSGRLAAQARKDVEAYTWVARAKNILNFLQ